MKIKKAVLCPVLFCVAVLLSLIRPVPVLAAELPLTLKGKDTEQGGYRYEMAGFGGFTALLEDGDTGEMNILSIDDSLSCSVSVDGQPASDTGDNIYMTVGRYEMTFTPKGQENGAYTAKYTFTVDNDLGVGYSFKDLKMGFEKTDSAQASYDNARGMYQYTLPNSCSFYMSVPEGAWSEDPVQLFFDDSLVTMEVLQNGNSIDEPVRSRFIEPGDYCLQLTCRPGDYDGNDLNIYRYDVHFRILKNGFVKDSILTAPAGYELAFLEWNGRPERFSNTTSKALKKDGKYRARFKSLEDDFPDYTISFKRDTIIPGVEFSAPVEGGVVKAPLTIKKTEEDSEIKVTLDGIVLSQTPDTLTKGGQYQVTVTDPAGNTEIYSFYLKQEYHLFNRQMVVLLVLVLFGGGALAWLNGFYIRVK